MEEADSATAGQGWKARVVRVCLALLGIAGLLIVAVALEERFGIPFKITYRVAIAVACLVFIVKIGSDYPGERWPRTAFWVALLFNIGVFFSPLAQLPASKGDILFFAAPDAAILLAARIVSYRVTNDHQRAVRQQMSLGLVVTFAFCAVVLTMML